MAEDQKKRLPGDAIIDRCMPHASEAEREEARENLHAFARVILRVEAQLVAETRERMIREKSDGAVESAGGAMPPP